MRRCPAHERRPTTTAGFTLVEIAVVIVVLGFLLAMIAGIATALIGQQRREMTRQRMAGVETALALFVSQNKRLPCPADGRLIPGAMPLGPPDLAGLEERTSLGKCVVGKARLGSANADRQTDGVVPWREIGLTHADITDGWGTLLTYRVAPELVIDGALDFTACDPGAQKEPLAVTTVGACSVSCPSSSPPSTWPTGCTNPQDVTKTKGLRVCSLSGAVLMNPSPHLSYNSEADCSFTKIDGTPPGSSTGVPASTGAAYVVISHGENRGGGYDSLGVLQAGSPASGTNESTRNAANVFFEYASSGAAKHFFDDFPDYKDGAGHFDDTLLRPSILTVTTRAQLGPRAH